MDYEKKKIILTISSNEVGGHPIRFANLFGEVIKSIYLNFKNPLKHYIKKDLDSATFHGYSDINCKSYYLPVVGNSNFSFITSFYILLIKLIFKNIKIFSYGSFNSHLFVGPDIYITYGSDLHDILNPKYINRSNFISKIINKMKMRLIFKRSKTVFIDKSFFSILDKEFKDLIAEKIAPIPYISLFEKNIYVKKKASTCLNIILLSRIDLKPEGVTDDKNTLEILLGINMLAKKTKKKINLSLRQTIYIDNIRNLLDSSISISIIKPIKRPEFKKLVSSHDVAIDTFGLPVLNYSAIESIKCGVMTITNFNPCQYKNLFDPPIIPCASSTELFSILKRFLNLKNRLIHLNKIKKWNKRIAKEEKNIKQSWLKSFNLDKNYL